MGRDRIEFFAHIPWASFEDRNHRPAAAAAAAEASGPSEQQGRDPTGCYGQPWSGEVFIRSLSGLSTILADGVVAFLGGDENYRVALVKEKSKKLLKWMDN
jgi:hypothetical protein